MRGKIAAVVLACARVPALAPAPPTVVAPLVAPAARTLEDERAEAGRAFDLSAGLPVPAAPVAAATGENPGPRPGELAAGRDEAGAPPSAGEPAPPPPSSAEEPSPSGTYRFLAQAAARCRTLAQRVLTLPAFFWPFSSLARLVAHGEPIVGLTPAAAVRAAERLAAGGGVVIGQLAWELRDPWSTRGAERSYLSLIEALAEAKAKRPGLDAAVSIDAETLGLQLLGVPAPERERIAGDAALRLARAARSRGLPLEIDMGTSDAMPFIVRIARRVVLEAGIPVRLALAARYRSSERALRDWSDLARETGLRLGVRLVKGSFIEADQPDAINARGPLIRRYKEIVTLALERGRWLAVAVASHNEEIWRHARAEARRLDADFAMHVIQGVNLPLQDEMRAAGKLERVYVSYGADAAVMGLTELYTNWRQRRALAARGAGRAD